VRRTCTQLNTKQQQQPQQQQQQHHQQPGHNPPLTRNIFTLSLLFSNNMNYMNDSTAGSNMEECPSTYFDLLFWCLFFVVPITAGWTLFLWRSFLHRELYNLYNKNPATSTTTTSSSSSSAKVLPIQARVVDKQARTVHEYRRSNLDPFQAEREAFPVAPFFLTVQYTPDATSGTRTTASSSSSSSSRMMMITKQLEVEENTFHQYAVGSTMELVYLRGIPASGMFLPQLYHQTVADHSSMVGWMMAEILAFGLCATSAWCLAWGWTLVLVCFMGTFFVAWTVLNRRSNTKLRQQQQQEYVLGNHNHNSTGEQQQQDDSIIMVQATTTTSSNHRRGSDLVDGIPETETLL